MEVLTPQFTKICSGLRGAEGPVFTVDGKFFMVAPTKEESEGVYAGEIVTVELETGKWEVINAPRFAGHGGVPAGLQLDREGHIWVADMRHGLLTLNQDGSECIQVAETDSSGLPMQGCNDCAFDYDGNLWVTGPAAEIAPAPYKTSDQEAFGSVYCCTKDGQMIKVDANSYLFSNGIAVQHDSQDKPRLLIVAETLTKTLHAYDIIGPGKVENKRVWGKLPGEGRSGPDGMDFDADGNLLVANWGCSHIEVFGPEGGNPTHRIQCPFAKPSNIHFRPNSEMVYVTEHDNDALWKFTWRCKGKKQYCEM